MLYGGCARESHPRFNLEWKHGDFHHSTSIIIEYNRKVKNRQAKWVEEFKTFPPLSGSELWVLRPVRLRMNQNPHKAAGAEKIKRVDEKYKINTLRDSVVLI